MTHTDTPVAHVTWLRGVTHSTFDFHRMEALARCHGAADHIEQLEGEIVRLKEYNAKRGGEFACTEQRLASQIAKLQSALEKLAHDHYTNPAAWPEEVKQLIA